MHNPRSMLFGDFNRAVGGSIIGNDHLAVYSNFTEGSQSLVDAKCNRVRFIQAGNDNRDLRLIRSNIAGGVLADRTIRLVAIGHQPCTTSMEQSITMPPRIGLRLGYE